MKMPRRKARGSTTWYMGMLSARLVFPVRIRPNVDATVGCRPVVRYSPLNSVFFDDFSHHEITMGGNNITLMKLSYYLHSTCCLVFISFASISSLSKNMQPNAIYIVTLHSTFTSNYLEISETNLTHTTATKTRHLLLETTPIICVDLTRVRHNTVHITCVNTAHVVATPYTPKQASASQKQHTFVGTC
jgi:hypothetical protein